MDNIKIFYNMLIQLFQIMTQKQKRRCLFVLITVLIAAIFETLGVGVIIPYILSMTQPDEFMKNEIVMKIAEQFRVTSIFHMTVFMSAGIVLIYLVKSIVVLYSNYIQFKFRNELERDLSVLMLGSYLKRPYTYYLNINSAEIVRGISSDTDGVAQIVDGFFILITEGLTFLLIAAFMIALNPLVALCLMGAISICMIVVVLFFKQKMKKWGQKSRIASANRYQYAYQAVNGIKEITVMQRADSFIRQYHKAAQLACDSKIGFQFTNKIPHKAIEMIFIVAVVVLALISSRTDYGIITLIPQLGAIVFACVRLLPAFSSIAASINNLVYCRYTLDATYTNFMEAKKFEKQKDDYQESKGRLEEIYEPEKLFKYLINIRSIVWKYDKSTVNVLDDISLTIEKGDAIALIGESGAGKTTLADVILGLLKPQTGTVDVDGVDIFAIPQTWSKVVGYVPQGVFLIDDTVRNNILFGENQSNDSDKAVWKALEQAQLRSFIEQLPDGLDTLVGERGIKFSGGQRQRIAIARALYNNPVILVLDEATSALDNETETAVMESIDALKGHKTLIIIAHRLSTIRNCNKIYEIKDGKAELVRQ